MKISLIASPNGGLFMTWDNGKNQYPYVVADFGNLPANIVLANELTLLYNNQQELVANAPDNVSGFKAKDIPIAPPRKEEKKDE